VKKIILIFNLITIRLYAVDVKIFSPASVGLFLWVKQIYLQKEMVIC